MSNNKQALQQQIEILYMLLHSNPSSISKIVLQGGPIYLKPQQQQRSINNSINMYTNIINKQKLMQQFLQEQLNTKCNDTMIMSFGNKSDFDPFVSLIQQQKKNSVGQTLGQTSPSLKKSKYNQKQQYFSPSKKIKSFDLMALCKSRQQRIRNESSRQNKNNKKNILMSPISKNYLIKQVSPQKQIYDEKLNEKSNIFFENSKKQHIISPQKLNIAKKGSNYTKNKTRSNYPTAPKKAVAIEISLPQIVDNSSIDKQKTLISQIMVDLKKMVGKLKNDSLNTISIKNNTN